MTDEDAMLAAFKERPALFATELRRATRSAIDASRFEGVLAACERAGVVRVAVKSAPDPHLADADLRIVAPASDGADAAIDEAWRVWLAEFLRSHRCT